MLLLGACTVASAVLAAAFFETDEGPDLFSRMTGASLVLSALLLIGTVIAFVGAARTAPPAPRAVLGLVLAGSVHPVAFLLAGLAVVLLNACGVSW